MTKTPRQVFVPAGGTIPFVASRFAIIDDMDVIPGSGWVGRSTDTAPREG
jgi:hypothetical protein